MVAILLNANLISNVDFDADAAYTPDFGIYSDVKVNSMDFALSHPVVMLPNHVANAYTAQRMFNESFPLRILRKTQTTIQ